MSFLPTARSFNSQHSFYVHEPVSQVGVMISNFYVNKYGQEVGSGAPVMVTASIWLPAAARWMPLSFNGSSQASIADADALASDLAVLPEQLQPDVRQYLRFHGLCPNGLPMFNQQAGSGTGEVMQWDTAGTLPDTTLGGGIRNTNNCTFPPLVVFGPTTLPSVAIWGDSIADGYGKQPQDMYVDEGPPAKGLGPSFNYTKLCRTGARLSQQTLVNTVARRSVMPLITHQAIQLGINDFGDHDANAMLSYSQTIASFLPGGETLAGTITPRTNAANTAYAWGAGAEAQRSAYNDALRSGQSFLAGYFEVADTVESARDSGFWADANDAVDGCHPTATGSAKMTSGWNPNLIA